MIPRRLVAVVSCLVAALLAAGCGGSDESPSTSIQRSPSIVKAAPQPVAVPPFVFEPDVVLLVTGTTHGMLEACDCPGPPGPGMSRRGGLVASYRAAFPGKCVLVDTGDFTDIEPEHARNAWTIAACKAIGYDVLALGDQEWACSNEYLNAMLPRSEAAVLRGNLNLVSPGLSCAVPSVCFWRGSAMLQIIDEVTPGALIFLRNERKKDLHVVEPKAFRDAAEENRRAGRTVIAIVHGPESDVEHAAEDLPADLILWGHTEKAAANLLDMSHTPVVRVGGLGYVGVVALKLKPSGRIDRIDYRREVLDKRWPVDERLHDLFQRYVKTVEKK